MKKVCKQIRQGDVLVTPIDKIPDSAKKKEVKDRIILAEGEMTGHHHSIEVEENKVETFTNGEEVYRRVNEPVVLTHQEHAEATIEPGDYLVKRQTETWLDEIRQVVD